MYADPQTSEIVGKLIPDLESLTDVAKAGWRSEIHSISLREAMFANVDMAADLLLDVLFQNGVPLDTCWPEDERYELFKVLIGHNIEMVDRRCGLLWHAHEIADLIATGQICAASMGWSVEDLRFALAKRAEVSRDAVATPDLEASVKLDGAACLSAWLTTLPEPLATLLNLSTGTLGKRFREKCRTPNMSEICQLTLSEMEQEQ